MSSWLIAVVTILYASISISYLVKGNLGMAWIWGGYALANGGFLYLELSK